MENKALEQEKKNEIKLNQLLEGKISWEEYNKNKYMHTGAYLNWLSLNENK
tara:strand:+ start:19681 stop:19833 length:153 start_codon:yes stop_codon:yes gene_type:complete